VSARARPAFDTQDVVIACAVALLAQLMFVLVFSLPSPKLIQADISNDNGQPIAVAITPVLKLGSKTPTKLPSQWQRRQPVAAKSQPQAALPSTKADKMPETNPTSRPVAAVVDAGKPEPLNPIAPEDAGAAATVSSAQGAEQGAENGTETDPLKARAADMYKAQLAAWFVAHFNIRGKIPFDKLKTLRSTATVMVTPDRKVGSFSIVKPSGDPTFDAEVESTLAHIQSSGAELPAPPPMYPEMLAKSQSFSFQCTVRNNCE
jgi:hypothetical protein